MPGHVAAPQGSCSATPAHSWPPSYPAAARPLQAWLLAGVLGGAAKGRDGAESLPIQAVSLVPAPCSCCLLHCALSPSPSLSVSLGLASIIPGLLVSGFDKLCCVSLRRLLSPPEPWFPCLDSEGGGLGFSSQSRRTLEALPSGGASPGPNPWPLSPRPPCAVWGPAKGAQAWGCPPPTPTFRSPDSPASLPTAASTSCCAFRACGSSLGSGLPPSCSPRPFITLSQIFVLADKSLVLELSLGGLAVGAGGPLDTIQPKSPTPTVHTQKLRPRVAWVHPRLLER